MRGRSEMGQGGRKHLLFPAAGYGTRDLILASSRRWLRTRRKMKGRHMEDNSRMGYNNGVRNYCIDSFRLDYHVFVWSKTTVEATCAR